MTEVHSSVRVKTSNQPTNRRNLMSVRKVNSHRHIKSKKKAAIIQAAIQLGVITNGSRLISMMKLPLLHSFTQTTLEIELSDLVISRLLKEHISGDSRDREGEFSHQTKPMRRGGNFPVYTMAVDALAMPLSF